MLFAPPRCCSPRLNVVRPVSMLFTEQQRCSPSCNLIFTRLQCCSYGRGVESCLVMLFIYLDKTSSLFPWLHRGFCSSTKLFRLVHSCLAGCKNNIYLISSSLDSIIGVGQRHTVPAVMEEMEVPETLAMVNTFCLGFYSKKNGKTSGARQPGNATRQQQGGMRLSLFRAVRSSKVKLKF